MFCELHVASFFSNRCSNRCAATGSSRGAARQNAPSVVAVHVSSAGVQLAALAPSSKNWLGKAPKTPLLPSLRGHDFPKQQLPSTINHRSRPFTTNATPWTRTLDSLVTATLLIVMQTFLHRAARVAEPHGEEADEGIHERALSLSDTIHPHGILTLLSDVLQPRAAMFRQLRQRLREQVAYLARRRLRHEMRRQAHEGLAALGRPVSGAERCNGTRTRRTRSVNSTARALSCMDYHTNT
jgi:hypothetical protein